MTDLASVIKSIESNGNQHAMRFEYGAYSDWPWSSAMERIRLKHKCSINTARMVACTSWGLYQIMGQNIFDPQYALQGIDPPDVFSFVGDAGMQDALFHEFLKLRAIDFSLDDLLGDQSKMTLFVTRYNGPGNIDGYSALIRSHANAS